MFLAAAHPACRGAPPPPPPPAESCDERAAALRARHRDEGFTVRVVEPFVVAGDDTPDRVEGWADTVRWARRHLRREYFRRDPEGPIEIWLLRDAARYDAFVRRRLGRAPSTPYGFFSRRERALFMNLATGGGTLVHELVHPYVAANLPRAPPWLNEGLGTLYEHCGEDSFGRIRGEPNWRLPALQRALADGRLPPFETLLALDDAAFRGAGSDLHYAASRYLLYFLQEEGRLRRFYHDVADHLDRDPTGLEALRRLALPGTLADLRARWEAFVLSLAAPS